MKIIRIILLLPLVFSISCSSRTSEDSAAVADVGYAAEIKVADVQRTRTQYLAYTHRVSVALPAGQLEEKYNRLLDWCSSDEKYHCTMMRSYLQTDNYVSGNVAVRIKPDGVAEILALASGDGEVTSKGTSVQDLGEAIVDNQKRLEMLKDYRARLEALSGKSSNDVDALVKLAGEMAKVQSDLESATGQRKKLLQRVEMDVVEINLNAYSQRSFLFPIKAAFKEFGGQLSEGIADTVTTVAYLLPWTLLLLVVILIIRTLWARMRHKRK